MKLFMGDYEILGLYTGTVIRLLALLFLAITFLQAGLDKAFDFKGNKAYFTSHFEKTPLAKLAGTLMPVIMLMEIVSGLLAVAGIVLLLINQENAKTGMYAACASMLTLLCLFFGQRIGKFYGEAAGIVPYIIMTFLSMWLFAL